MVFVAQCGNFKIFLALRFYLKSIGHFEVPKTAILTILAPLNYELLGISDVFKCEIGEIVMKIKIQSHQNC